MNYIEALILGILQGLTEFLPVSSSGHLEIGKALLGVCTHDNLKFTIVVHGATVLSTLVVFRKDILDLIRGVFDSKFNDSHKYCLSLIISMIPIAIVGVFFKDSIESVFNLEKILLLVGCMLIFTACLLSFTYFSKNREKSINYKNALLIGIAQVFAILPGISRSGTTIAAGLLFGVKKEEVTKFSFLMVLVPIIGENILSILSSETCVTSANSIGAGILLVGFVSAFLSGLLACSWMIKMVKSGKLIYFAIYCLIIGLITIFVSW
ncbi:MAG: undecaprenyl-diphosphate phosphatase [Marinifilaceae bacterium]|jgi:undecaprenyl-diphosphatase|nr:undecaprenyl-diphosphate phosphatase [Marinifilaceae bacterium]